MRLRVKFILIILVFFACVGVFLSIGLIREVRIVDAKMATALDEKLMPVKAADNFPRGTSQVYCWLQWKNSKPKIEVTARWYYVTDDIHILDYKFKIPRKQGSGGVLLSMPKGKVFPEGEYRVDLVRGWHLLKTLTFKVE